MHKYSEIFIGVGVLVDFLPRCVVTPPMLVMVLQKRKSCKLRALSNECCLDFKNKEKTI